MLFRWTSSDQFSPPRQFCCGIYWSAGLIFRERFQYSKRKYRHWFELRLKLFDSSIYPHMITRFSICIPSVWQNCNRKIFSAKTTFKNFPKQSLKISEYEWIENDRKWPVNVAKLVLVRNSSDLCYSSWIRITSIPYIQHTILLLWVLLDYRSAPIFF